MTKEEYRTWKWNYKFNGLAIGGDDELGELLREIYYSGYNDGFRHAINLLQQFEGGHCLDMDIFFDRNMAKIQKRLDAIRELEDDRNKKTGGTSC